MSNNPNEKEEAQKCQDEINAIIATARAEGRALTPEEEEQIRQYYARIKQIELECQASNSYEIEYAQKDFQNRINTADGKTSQELLEKRYKDYKYNELLALLEGYLNKNNDEDYLYLPDIYFVKEGKIIGHDNESAFVATSNEEYSIDEIKNKLFNKYVKLLNDYNREDTDE